MITATYHRQHNRLKVIGHAKSAPKGEDLVCAACTILVHTLEADVNHLASIGAVTDHMIDVKDGAALISCTPVRRYQAVVSNVFESVCVGFEILADKFPNYVKYEIMG